ncbi:hypothetical protein GSI_05091 [Ganoderma sinense ZZ0214-1]|uniref:DUF3669 domain-containing protein n=1 Tax=Ganoderma sinense ZZ0214-1 TaxID=1077348 RepID=A0A2G8SGT8_9APHY|nr:hypothetical protein GSI_05091 [Ganoderma sinense ZZ0214-1]
MAISSSLTDCENSQEPTIPTRIGAGSFAAVFASPGRTIAIKVAHAPDHTAQVEWEFTSLQAVLAATQNDNDALFIVPRPLAFYDPQSQRLVFPPPPRPSSPIGHEATASRRRHTPRQPPFTPDFFSNLPPRPCYVMDRASPLPPHIANRIRMHFYPESAVGSVPPPLICRLYLGKELRPSAFVNPVNFPLDAARYDLLRDWDEDVPSKDEVAEGMGEMLALIHWQAGYDARDVEFVMSGAPKSTGLRFYVIDFNQMRAFDRDEGDVSELVDAFFVNDPYYPRPIPGDALYDSFKRGYVRACPEDRRTRADLFLQAIEAREEEKHHNPEV